MTPPPTLAVRRPRGRPLRRWHPLDLLPARLLLAGPGPLSPLPPAVPGGPGPGLHGRPTPLLRIHLPVDRRSSKASAPLPSVGQAFCLRTCSAASRVIASSSSVAVPPHVSVLSSSVRIGPAITDASSASDVAAVRLHERAVLEPERALAGDGPLGEVGHARQAPQLDVWEPAPSQTKESSTPRGSECPGEPAGAVARVR